MFRSTILANYTVSSAQFPSVQAEQGRHWNDQNHNQPNLGVRPCATPQILIRDCILSECVCRICSERLHGPVPHALGRDEGDVEEAPLGGQRRFPSEDDAGGRRQNVERQDASSRLHRRLHRLLLVGRPRAKCWCPEKSLK